MKIKKRERGITLIALIVSIIILIILAAITTRIILGDNGIIEMAKKAVIEMRISEYKENLMGIEASLADKRIFNGLVGEKYLESFKEKVEESEIFKEKKSADIIEGKKEGEKRLRIVTKEGYIFDITEEDIQYMGNRNDAGYGEIPELKTGDITINAEPSNWTSKKVKVTIEQKEEYKQFKIEYAIRGEEAEEELKWEKYTIGEEIEVEDNGTQIYARLTNELGETTKVNAYTKISNIDREKPDKEEIEIEAKETTNSITVTVGATDKAETKKDGQSGVKEIYIYYSEDEGATWKGETKKEREIGTGEEGTEYREEVTYNNLTQGKKYKIKVKVIDQAGNEEEKETDVTTGTVPKAEGNITYSYTPTEWTKGNVTVTLGKETSVSGYTLQYQLNETTGTWTNYTKALTITANNTTIYSRLIDSTSQAGVSYASGKVTNIDKVAPTVTATKGTVTTNSAVLNVSASDSPSGLADSNRYTYYKSATTVTDVSKATKVTANNTAGYTFTGLTQKTAYRLWVVVADKAGNTTTKYVDVTAGTVPKAEGNITYSYTPTEWTKGNVTVTLGKGTSVSGYTLQYQLNGTTGTWTNYTKALTITTNDTTIYSRLLDSTSQAGVSYASGKVTNIDKVAPTVSATKGTVTANSAKLNVSASDSPSGLAASNAYTYYRSATTVTDVSKATKVTANNTAGYTFTGLSPSTEYRLWVVVADKAGNTTTKYVDVTTAVGNYSIGSTYYTTLAEAYNAASAGATIVAQKSPINDTSAVTMTKNITLNTNGKTINRTKKITVNSGTLTITGNGKIICNGSKESTILINSPASLATSGTPLLQSNYNAVYLDGESATANFNGGYLYSTGHNTLILYGGNKNTVNITNTNVYNDNYDSNAIYILPKDSSYTKLNIGGSSIIGNGANNKTYAADGTGVAALRCGGTTKLTLSGTAAVRAGPYRWYSD